MQIFKAQRIKHGLYTRSQYVPNSGRNLLRNELLDNLLQLFQRVQKTGLLYKTMIKSFVCDRNLQ